jgi:alpha-beta hydrolase superfamily lysophospholipase
VREPFYFGPAERPLFGWLHLPATPRADIGLLICGPTGYEAICCHRTLRHLAEAAESRGMPALRFDYDGTGDSAGSDEDPGRLAAWLHSIRVAAAELAARSGVARIGIAGIRLGASLALLAAQDLPLVSDAVLVAPVADGRRYLRELRALAATAAVDAAAMPGSGAESAAGFITTSATRIAIGGLRLAQGDLHVAPPRVLLMDRSDLPADAVLEARLQQLGSTVTHGRFDGYADMMRDPHENVVPVRMIEQTLDWLQPAHAATSSRPDPLLLLDQCEFECSDAGSNGGLRERTVRMGVDQRMFGIVTEPRDASAQAAPVLLLLNSGAVHHIGPNRLYVRIARELALRGMRVLRLDLPGLGDSPAPAGQAENQSYPDYAVAAMAQVVEFARAGLGASTLHCAGICSGAYHSLKSALAGHRLQGIVVINPLTFYWKPGMSLAASAYLDIGRIMRMRQAPLSATRLRRLMASPATLVDMARTLGRHVLRRSRSAAREVARKLGMRLHDDLARDLRTVAAHGTRMHFVFASTDPGHALLRYQAGREVVRLVETGAATMDFIEEADHTFTPPAAQQALVALVADLMQR